MQIAELQALKEIEESVAGKLADHGRELVALRGQIVDLAQRGTKAPRDGGGGGGGSAEIGHALSGCRKDLEAMAGGQRREVSFSVRNFDIKTILGPTTAGAAALQYPDSAQEFVAPEMRRLSILALLPSLPTNAGATQYTEVSTTTSGAAIQGADSSPLEKEGAIIGESSFTYTLRTADVATIATWIPASIQVLDDMNALERQINTWLRYFLALEAETEVLTGTGASLHINGLNNQAAAYNRGATSDTRADTLRKAITQLSLANHTCSFFVLNPNDAEAIDLLKDSNQNYLRVIVNGRAWSVPVVESNTMTLGQFLAGDSSAALVRTREETIIEVSNSHEDFFTRALVAIRARVRLGLEVHRTAGFVLGSF